VVPKLLDLFCGAGGASMGYYRAGFEVMMLTTQARRAKHIQRQGSNGGNRAKYILI